MADGPAGLRLTSEFGVDEDGNKIETGPAMPFFKEIFGDPGLNGKKAVAHYYQYCTAIPIATMLAQSWNMDMLHEIGDMIGEEMEGF